MGDTLSNQIETNAAKPARASGDEGSVAQHSLKDQIAADQYIEARSALRDRTRKTFGVRMGKLVPPGSV